MGEAQRHESNVTKLRANEGKWGSVLMTAGWTCMPSTILERQSDIGLDPVDMNILLQLARYWWQADNPPHPAIKTIAKCIGKSVSTVQRRITKMKEAGLIDVDHRHDKNGGQMTSNYGFGGLITAATPFAIESIEEKEENRAKKAARLKRKVAKPSNLKVHSE